MKKLNSLLLGILGNFITMFVVSIGAFIGTFYAKFYDQPIISLVNTTLLLFMMFLMLYLHYSPKRPLVVRKAVDSATYLIENHTYHHIPDKQTFEYLGELNGFQWTDIKVLTVEEFENQFSAGSSLPSILPHCKKELFDSKPVI